MWPKHDNRDSAEILGNNIKKCREAAGLSVKQLAEEICGYPERYLLDIESGHHMININLVCSISRYFTVDTDILAGAHYFNPHDYGIGQDVNSENYLREAE